MLFHETIFGPVRSRRLGVSLGINLLPKEGKICSFDCIYCECGLNSQGTGEGRFAACEEVLALLEAKLREMIDKQELPDVITFAGNGEPTMHPDFENIVDGVIDLRNRHAPQCKIAVLSNATMLHKPGVIRALLKIDDNIQKIDGGSDEAIRQIDMPNSPDYSVKRVVEQLRQFNGKCIVQTLFLRGTINEKPIDNTTDEEISLWLQHLREIAPQSVMIYSYSRITPFSTLEQVSHEELEKIAEQVQQLGIKTSVA